MSSKVYFLPWKKRNELYKFLKKAKAFEHVKARNFIAIKIHFGEDGNEGYIKPQYVAPVVKIAREKTAFPFLTDCSTIYVGKRSDAYHHALLANKHGFTIESCGCPVIIADGIRGNTKEYVKVNLKHFKTVSIGSDIAQSDGFIFMNHFKGHEISGFGGALKNIGMGCGSKEGKYAMHHSSKPAVKVSKCTACGNCVKHCYQGALKLVNKKIVMDKKKCVGCGQCIVSCVFGVFELNWNESPKAVQEKIVEYAAGVLKNKKASYINFLNHISKNCDCFSVKNPPLMEDVGIVAGADPVAVDQASYDLVNKAYGKNFFKKIFPEIDPTAQLEYAEKIGLGTRDYELINY
ncbi:DUF362 domain-containing protein [Endomicrobium proavitum]|uniref:4Fe-4S ferredoxin iron-sulfur binding domain protein n=1 Tax=Endomicrobium proavitum TaxID=1408281 RepID=A0A0G3WJ01_9BACT|nr:DUF362 domain-containing protein [Endomicrobium proavitum]AKL97870.1 4Fe-4S ferredoxin iron-sulfur binding domain protein [Endomicrobium proavitum]